MLSHALDEKEVMNIYWAVEKERKEKSEGGWIANNLLSPRGGGGTPRGAGTPTREAQVDETPKERKKRHREERRTKDRIYRYKREEEHKIDLN